MTSRTPAAALAALLWLASPIETMAASEPPTEQDKQEKNEKEKKPPPEPKLWTSKHQIRIGGKGVDYEATTGTLLMKDDKDEPIALFGFTAYVRQGQDARTRPIMFAYNGGPGSASAWLHMGILGPRRAVLEDLQSNTRGPFKVADNEFSPLDRADIVHDRPGRHRLLARRPARRRASSSGASTTTSSPSPISSCATSGSTSAGRARSSSSAKATAASARRRSYDLLRRHNVALNGIILVSPFMDFPPARRV